MKLADRCALAVVTCGGIGLMRVAPGTYASLAAAGALYGLERAGLSSTLLLATLTLAASILCVALGGWSERHFGGKDPGAVVIDEAAGQWLALCVPIREREPLLTFALAFALFRLFDILKPLGIRRLQAAPRGWGILLDDLVAGLCAAGIIQGVAMCIA